MRTFRLKPSQPTEELSRGFSGEVDGVLANLLHEDDGQAFTRVPDVGPNRRTGLSVDRRSHLRRVEPCGADYRRSLAAVFFDGFLHPIGVLVQCGGISGLPAKLVLPLDKVERVEQLDVMANRCP
jgi:hypothetical protein